MLRRLPYGCKAQWTNVALYSSQGFKQRSNWVLSSFVCTGMMDNVSVSLSDFLSDWLTVRLSVWLTVRFSFCLFVRLSDCFFSFWSSLVKATFDLELYIFSLKNAQAVRLKECFFYINLSLGKSFHRNLNREQVKYPMTISSNIDEQNISQIRSLLRSQTSVCSVPIPLLWHQGTYSQRYLTNCSN